MIGVDNPHEKFGRNIIALGRTTNQEELAEYYSMADITLLTSKRETFSMVAAESLCCGTPVVGFEAGAPEEIVPEDYGIFVPYGDMNKLEKAVRDFLDNPPRKEDITNFACENYGKDMMTNRYIDLYREIREKG